MLLSLVAALEARTKVTVPVTHGETMQSELFRQLDAVNPLLSSQIHGDADDLPRPYTISPLNAAPRFVQNGMLCFQPGDRCWFRLTGLRAEVSELLLALSETARSWQIHGRSFAGEFAIQRWLTRPGEHLWAGQISVEDLGHAACHACDRQPDRIVLKFETPTTFEVASESAWGSWMPLPVPRLVFGNLRNRAAAFCPEIGAPLGQAEVIETGIALGRFRGLESHMLHFQRRNRRRVGFTGECEFLLDRDLDVRERLMLHFLAGFAFYSGVGAGTSWAMGQAYREPVEDFLYRGVPDR